VPTNKVLQDSDPKFSQSSQKREATSSNSSENYDEAPVEKTPLIKDKFDCIWSYLKEQNGIFVESLLLIIYILTLNVKKMKEFCV